LLNSNRRRIFTKRKLFRYRRDYFEAQNPLVIYGIEFSRRPDFQIVLLMWNLPTFQAVTEYRGGTLGKVEDLRS
jgi:hypothetical protein